MKKSILFLLALHLFGWEFYQHGKLQHLTPLPLRSISSIHYFLTPRGVRIGVDNRVVFLPKSKECKERIFQRYRFSYKRIGKSFLFFTSSSKEAFDVANSLYESGCVEYAHPDFLVSPKKRFLDPLFPQQWNIYNYGQYGITPDIDLNVYEAWRYSEGAGIKVALIDDGFESFHEDLQGAFAGGYDILHDSTNFAPKNPYELHGTLCAGVIGARNNGKGLIGIAPKAKLYGYKLFSTDSEGNPLPIYTSDIVRAFQMASSADVISCSWGTYDVADNVREIIDYLAHHGRDGKGIPIVFADGNDGMDQSYWANDESALDSVIAVGAVTDSGEVAWYSNYGPALDFVAPSGGGSLNIASTDLMGDAGLADGRYGHPNYAYAIDDTGFNGTSAAAPQVAGVIALMLAKDPSLTRDEIVDILKRTARKVGNLPYINGRNDYYGYGLVDAKAAMEEVIRREENSTLSVEANGTLTLVQGKWNLITTPIPAPMPVSILNGYTSQPIYTFDSALYEWKTDSEAIEVGKGYWIWADLQGGKIRYQAVSTVSNKAEQWNMIKNDLIRGRWSLVGTSFDTNKTEVRQALGVMAVWPYDPAINNYSTRENIVAGQGFWVK